MNPLALLFVVVAAFAHASWNYQAKKVGSGGAPFVWLYCSLSLVPLVPVTVAEVLLAGQRPAWDWLVAVLVSGLLHVAYFLLLQRGYATGDLSVVYPLARGTGPLVSVLLAVLVLGERPGALALVGAAAVVCGVFVIGTAAGGSAEEARPAGALRMGIGFGLVTGLTIAGYTLWDAHAVTALGVPPLVQMAGTSAVEAVLLTPVALRERARVALLWREHRRPAWLIAVLSPLAYVLVLYALRLAPVALVAPARELGIVVAGIAAWRLLGEPRAGRRLAGAVIVLVGVAVLALA